MTLPTVYRVLAGGCKTGTTERQKDANRRASQLRPATDASFAAIDLLNEVRPWVTMITRLRLDAALHRPLPRRRPGTVGRPPVVGKRLPSLKQRLASGPGDGPAPDTADPAATTQLIGGDCELPTS